tara:strand:- start:62 stop:304 length:243 start_codon:yes stop_codon:yes gene_type:complete
MENNSLKETVIDYCLNVLKRDDIKNELKQLMRPMMDVVLQEIYPYIFLSMIFVFISFLLILAIFILLLRYKINTSIIKKL